MSLVHEEHARVTAAATSANPLEALRALSTEWIGHPQDGLTASEIEELLHGYVDEVEAEKAEDYDGTHVSDHCPECGESEPECVCDDSPAICHNFEDDDTRGTER